MQGITLEDMNSELWMLHFYRVKNVQTKPKNKKRGVPIPAPTWVVTPAPTPTLDTENVLLSTPAATTPTDILTQALPSSHHLST